MTLPDILIVLVLLAGGAASVVARKLTPIAAATGVGLGYCIYKGGGYNGLGLLATFFITGTAATSWGLRQKQKLGIAEERGGRRTTGQVWANAGVASIAGLLVWVFPQQKELFQLMIAGSFSAATADTLSSEMGNLYGRRFYNILSFKKDQRGLNGVVSLEGTVCGIAGSTIISLLACISLGFGYFIWIIVAGTIGNFADSVLGATVERQGWLDNNAVNFLNTLAGALVAAACYNF